MLSAGVDAHNSYSFPLGYRIRWASQVALVVKDLPVNAEDTRDLNWIPGSGRFSGVGSGSSLPYSCPPKLHGQRSLVGYNPRGHKELNTAEHAHKYK